MTNLNINSFLSQLKRKYFWQNILMYIIGIFLSATAFNLCFNRFNIIAGGSNGVALLLSNYISIDISILILITDLICLLIGLIFFGWEYGCKMITITLIYPLFVTLTSLFTNKIDLGNTSLFLIMVIGGCLSGMSNGFIRKSGFSTGGLCSIIDILHKYLHVSIGTANKMVNGTVILLGGLYLGVDKIIYAVVALLVCAYMVDKITLGISSNKVFYIITEKPFEINEYINENLNYDVTLIKSRGGYTNKKREMLVSVVSTFEYIKLKELVKEIDPKAFFLIVDIYESSVRKKCKNA